MLNYKSYYDLSRDIAAGAQLLPEVDIVVGVPKSGLVPATMIASFLNVQMFDLDSFLFAFSPRSGVRRHKVNKRTRLRVLVVDDSVNTGKESARVKRRIAEIGGDFDLTFCAIYGVAPGAHDEMVDLVLANVPHPRVFQWNYRNHIVAEHALFDMDGVLCADPPEEKNDDGPLYIDFILNAPPLFIPRKKISAIVTSRLERFRAETEQWLRENEVDYGELIMLDLPTAEERRRLRAHAPFKSRVYAARDEVLFVESNWKQAKAIAKATDKPVICTENDIMLMGAEHVHDLNKQNQLSDVEKLDVEANLRREVAELTHQLGLARPQLEALIGQPVTKPVWEEAAPMRKERETQRIRRETAKRFPQVPGRSGDRRILMISRTFDPKAGAGAAMSSLRLRDALSAAGTEVFTLEADDFDVGPKQRINQPILGQNLGYWNHYFDRANAEKLLQHIERIDPDAIVMGAVDSGVLSILDLALIRRPIVWCGRDNWMHTGGCLFKLEPEAISEPGMPESAFMEALTCTQYQTGCSDCPAIASPEERAKARAQFRLKSQVMAYRKDIVLAPISNWLNEMLRNAPLTAGHVIETVHNSINLDEFAPSLRSATEIRAQHSLPIETPLVLLAAHSLANPRKGLQLVLDQLAEVTALDAVEFVVMGRADLKDLPEELRVRIHPLGFISDEAVKRDIFSAVDAVLVPALQESLSVVASESIAAGKPVVAFRVGGLTDLVVHQETGFLAPPFDGRALLDGLAWVLFEADREALGAAARQRALEVLNADRNTGQLMAAVDTAIAQFADLGPLPDQLRETIALMGDLQDSLSFERQHQSLLDRQANQAAGKNAGNVRTPENARVFVVRGALAPRHLTQLHRLVLGTHRADLWPLVHFKDAEWANTTWAGKHLQKLDYVTLLDDPTRAPVDRRIEVSSTEDALVLTPAVGWNTPEEPATKNERHEPGIYILADNIDQELERLGSLRPNQILVLGKVAPSWMVQAGNSGFLKALLPAPEGWDEKLVVYGSKLSVNNLYELSMVARYLGLEPLRVPDLNGLDALPPDELAAALVAASKPMKISSATAPMRFDEAVLEVLSCLDDALESGTTLHWAIPEQRM